MAHLKDVGKDVAKLCWPLMDDRKRRSHLEGKLTIALYNLTVCHIA